MAVLSDGGFIISYVHVESGNSEIRAIRYSDTGAQLGSEMRLLTPALKKMFSPQVATLEDGGFAVVARMY
ncbi:hypothetical protein DS909_20415 [Phaeobacter gallaeciensis]|uniref:Uncharacterized protein n=2 Tax=Roseobacteraceae TaxID=2854170 RepID=A0A366WP25_9RHOB|nr:hypothetical protein [Falsiruegeria litorea]MBT3141514.1 hypothetical protein [Falsiruegeria litorea]RBW50917.1 hypothetical protein DS909_20415 [Phaeobacter gallaeciensis]